MEIHNSDFGRCPRVCNLKAEKPKVQMKDPNVGPFEKKLTVHEPAHFHGGFELVDYVRVFNNGELITSYSFPKYPVYFPVAEATYKKCWELREEQTETDDDYLASMRAHYTRMDPKEEVTYPEVDKEYFRPDPFNFYQRKQLCDGAKCIARFCDDDFKRMFVSEHHPSNPQHQTDFDYSDVEEKEEEIDYMGIGPESKGANKKEKAYWIGQVYLVNLRNGRRKTGVLKTIISTYFNISERSVINYSQFADSCNTLANDGQGITMANSMRTRAVAAAKKYSDEFFDWVLKPYDYGKRSKPWETFDGERGYAAKEAALRM